MWSDSTTALSQWSQIKLPTTVMDHLSAKSRRFFSWADKVAYTRYWPLTVSHLTGEHNDISHILSHLGEQARSRQVYLLPNHPLVPCQPRPGGGPPLSVPCGTAQPVTE